MNNRYFEIKNTDGSDVVIVNEETLLGIIDQEPLVVAEINLSDEEYENLPDFE